MTAYFDRIEASISTLRHLAEPAFLEGLRTVEIHMIYDVNLITGDREFPSDLRERIQSEIARWRVSELGSLGPTLQALHGAVSTRSSELVRRLHGLFHELGRRRVQVRFGLLSDKPDEILLHRRVYDEGLEDYEPDLASWIGDATHGVNIEVGFLEREEGVRYYAHAWVDLEPDKEHLLRYDGPHEGVAQALQRAVDAAVQWCRDQQVSYHIATDVRQLLGALEVAT